MSRSDGRPFSEIASRDRLPRYAAGMLTEVAYVIALAVVAFAIAGLAVVMWR